LELYTKLVNEVDINPLQT